MAYIYPAPGVSGVELTLTLTDNTDPTGVTKGSILVPALQDVTVNASNDVFTWTQLDATSKLNVATTATNSLSMNLVLNGDAFFGASGGTGTFDQAGIFGASTNKTLCQFVLYLGDNSDTTTGKTLTGTGYITGLAPTVSADSPVWVTPITITVDSDYIVS